MPLCLCNAKYPIGGKITVHLTEGLIWYRCQEWAQWAVMAAAYRHKGAGATCASIAQFRQNPVPSPCPGGPPRGLLNPPGRYHVGPQCPKGQTSGSRSPIKGKFSLASLCVRWYYPTSKGSLVQTTDRRSQLLSGETPGRHLAADIRPRLFRSLSPCPFYP